MKEQRMKLTLRVRIKDKHAKLLERMACNVNFCWNYANEISGRAWHESRRWLSGYDVRRYFHGCTRDGILSIPLLTVGCTVLEHAKKRQQFRRSKLRWRRNRKSLGWVPFQVGQTQWRDGAVVFYGHRFQVWDSYGLGDYKFRSGSFSQDSRGRWYFNVVVEISEQECTGTNETGIDLGLKQTATYSNGDTFVPGTFYRNLEPKLAVSQRARNKRRVRAIHTKIANQRKDALHKETTRLIQENKFIAVGDVNSSKLAKTRMAKSVLDAGWGMFKTMLKYKAIKHSVNFLVVNEAFTTRTCSTCGAKTGPQGVNGLRIREWTCSVCDNKHDRDHNAARNILALGSERLAGGTRA